MKNNVYLCIFVPMCVIIDSAIFIIIFVAL